jgi:hypothetical protein
MMEQDTTNVGVIRGKIRKPTQRQVRIAFSDIEQIVELSLLQSYFAMMGRTFSQTRVSCKSSPISPAL